MLPSPTYWRGRVSISRGCLRLRAPRRAPHIPTNNNHNNNSSSSSMAVPTTRTLIVRRLMCHTGRHNKNNSVHPRRRGRLRNRHLRLTCKLHPINNKAVEPIVRAVTTRKSRTAKRSRRTLSNNFISRGRSRERRHLTFYSSSSINHISYPIHPTTSRHLLSNSSKCGRLRGNRT